MHLLQVDTDQTSLTWQTEVVLQYSLASYCSWNRHAVSAVSKALHDPRLIIRGHTLVRRPGEEGVCLWQGARHTHFYHTFVKIGNDCVTARASLR